MCQLTFTSPLNSHDSTADRIVWGACTHLLPPLVVWSRLGGHEQKPAKPRQVKLLELPLESLETSVESHDLFCCHLGHYVLDGNEKRHSDKIKTTLALKSGLNLFLESRRIWTISLFSCCWGRKRKQKKAKICSSQTASYLPSN